MKTTKAILPALMLVTMALALPSAQATADLKTTSADQYLCQTSTGGSWFYCAGSDGSCATVWRDNDYDDEYTDGNATVYTHACAAFASR